MNHVILIGRLTKDPERASTSTPVTKYTLAVDRYGKKDEADFIRCVCFNKTAEFAEKYLHKGMKVAVEGHINTGSYDDKDGKKVYTTDVIVTSHEFCEKKNTDDPRNAPPVPSEEAFMNVPDGVDDEVPF